MGTNYPNAKEFAIKDLLTTSFNEVVRRKGVGTKTISLRYEKMRELLRLSLEHNTAMGGVQINDQRVFDAYEFAYNILNTEAKEIKS
ncbi:hypothetical protein A2619_01080 [candidate division WWE3 bacterium RIFOXYD1_FULL_39_9]|uniref:Uncharacterized protein n=1 Tax=candidate division WWE3 bacterium RIFOXYD1_FULL_39_9 TaxID=1802649 RepID=A0A1F4X6D1_UNCKA|nr:MAG: hypothetical protein A2619_01080 [candidate division WWE3 bacterium RIFOXYD1_FULL_39_9]